MVSVSVVIPTLNAEGRIGPLVDLLKRQTSSPQEILVVDSASEDATVQEARVHGADVMEIPRETFDHGATRDTALRQTGGDFVLLLTQDALPADERYIERLLSAFDDPRVAAASGRQVSKPDARPHVRAVQGYRYPAQSRVWGPEDRERLGIRAYHLSDVCSAYRRIAYEAVGGFPHPLATNEDMLLAARLLKAGYHLAYQAEAAVYHSHNFSLHQQYRRNALVGRFLEQYRAEISVSETGEGMAMVKTVLTHLLREGRPLGCAAFAMDCAARLLGNRAGRYIERKQGRRRRGADGGNPAGGL